MKVIYFKEGGAILPNDLVRLKELNELTAKELREYALEHAIEIPNTAKKADILKAISESEK